LGKIRAACRIDRLSHRLESQSESGDACGRGEPSSDARAQPPGTLPNPALTPGAIRTADPADVCGDRSRGERPNFIDLNALGFYAPHALIMEGRANLASVFQEFRVQLFDRP
jgi:hypothetical protein